MSQPVSDLAGFTKISRGYSNENKDVSAESIKVTSISCQQRVSAPPFSPLAGIPQSVSNPVPLDDQAICLFMVDYV